MTAASSSKVSIWRPGVAMTPEARRHYLGLLSDFNVDDVTDDELEQFLSPNMLRALGGFGLQLARLAQSLVRERARVAELEAQLRSRL